VRHAQIKSQNEEMAWWHSTHINFQVGVPSLLGVTALSEARAHL